MKKKIHNFKMQNRQFFQRNIKNIFLLKIIDKPEMRKKNIKYMHDENNHQNRKKTFRRVINQYY